MYVGRESLHLAKSGSLNDQPMERSSATELQRDYGGSMTSPRQRDMMVQRLYQLGIRHPLVLQAMGAVERDKFLDDGLRSRAYDDLALPIGHEQTISRPSVVARMLELAVGGPGQHGQRRGKALEVGTGCGYQAAVMSVLFDKVISVERIRALHQVAVNNLRPYRLYDVSLVFGDGIKGMVKEAPFDAVIIAAAGIGIPEALLQQLAVGGRLVAPVADNAGLQSLHLVERVSVTQWQQTILEEASFVPLKSGVR